MQEQLQEHRLRVLRRTMCTHIRSRNSRSIVSIPSQPGPRLHELAFDASDTQYHIRAGSSYTITIVQEVEPRCRGARSLQTWGRLLRLSSCRRPPPQVKEVAWGSGGLGQKGARAERVGEREGERAAEAAATHPQRVGVGRGRGGGLVREGVLILFRELVTVTKKEKANRPTESE